MKPPLFTYRAPTTIEEAVVALASDGDALVLAGGQSLLPALNFRVAQPSMLVDIQHVAGLRGISITVCTNNLVRLDPAIESGSVTANDRAAHRSLATAGVTIQAAMPA